MKLFHVADVQFHITNHVKNTCSEFNFPFYCSEICKENLKNSLIRPQFPSKSSFPFYRQILLLTNNNEEEDTLKEFEDVTTVSKVPKLKINLKTNLKRNIKFVDNIVKIV